MRVIITLILFIGMVACQAPIKQVEINKESVTFKKNNEVIGKLNTAWEDKYVTASATAPVPPGYKTDQVGQSLARDAALVKCRAELYSQLGEIKLTETISVLNAVVNSHRTSEMQGTLRGAKVIEDRWDADQKVHIISLQLKQVELTNYVKTWIDDGTINPNQLDNALNTIRK